MATRLGMLVIGVVAIAACVSVRPDDQATDDAGSARAVRSSSLPSPPPDLPLDAGAQRRAAPSQLDAETGDEDDAGLASLAEDIALDCRETLRCESRTASSLPACIASVTEALTAAPPEARARFRAIVKRCRALRECEYIRCVERASAAPR